MGCTPGGGVWRSGFLHPLPPSTFRGIDAARQRQCVQCATGSYPASVSTATTTELAGRSEQRTATERRPERLASPKKPNGLAPCES